MRLILLAGLLLAACAHTPSTRVETVETKVPVAIGCVKRANIPAEPPKIGDRLTDDSRVNEPILAASATRLRTWGRKLMALLIACGD